MENESAEVAPPPVDGEAEVVAAAIDDPSTEAASSVDDTISAGANLMGATVHVSADEAADGSGEVPAETTTTPEVAAEPVAGVAKTAASEQLPSIAASVTETQTN